MVIVYSANGRLKSNKLVALGFKGYSLSIRSAEFLSTRQGLRTLRMSFEDAYCTGVKLNGNLFTLVGSNVRDFMNDMNVPGYPSELVGRKVLGYVGGGFIRAVSRYG